MSDVKKGKLQEHISLSWYWRTLIYNIWPITSADPLIYRLWINPPLGHYALMYRPDNESSCIFANVWWKYEGWGVELCWMVKDLACEAVILVKFFTSRKCVAAGEVIVLKWKVSCRNVSCLSIYSYVSVLFTILFYF